MKKIILIISVLFVVANIYSQPQMKVHVYGGYNVPFGNLDGNSKYGTNTVPDVYAYMKSGFNAGADLKYFPGKKRNIGLLLNAAYNSYSTGDLAITGSSFTINSKLNDVRIGIGAEYDFMPMKKANPFIGIDLTGNFLSGKTTSSAGGTDQTLNSAPRFGLAVGAGVDIMVNKTFGFVIGAKFEFINLIGKQDSAAIGTLPANTYGLYDKAGTMNGVSYNAQNYMDLQIYGGVTFAFGQPKKMVKK